ncbi:uncharacterized protein LOC115986999 isoform X2 [Quercus lobata]|uniref:uncharacterized protein LOC115986999 isoform X2 n=1 Tax=Quercus lobata TaxID=97700 RepID=UPI00124436D8|nr:uncharacterized protein LOC115986999 isoform X2 [Quercus lobata]
MWRSSTMSSLLHRLAQRGGVVRAQFLNSSYSTMLLHQSQISNQSTAKAMASFQDEFASPAKSQFPDQNAGGVQGRQIGENVSRKDKINFLVNTVIKWMLSKGQGTTLGTYGQLIRALDMDHRAEEAHKIWVQKIGMDLHSVPWQLCRLMISVYHRNNMLEDLVKLFKNLEAFDRKPPEKSIVQRVADAYEMLGLLEEKQRVLEKYNDLFTENKSPKKGRISPYKKKKK